MTPNTPNQVEKTPMPSQHPPHILTSFGTEVKCFLAFICSYFGKLEP